MKNLIINLLLKSAAGINDKKGGENFLDQIQYLQDENEQAAATISYLKVFFKNCLCFQIWLIILFFIISLNKYVILMILIWFNI